MQIHDGAYGTLLLGHLHGDETVDDLCVRAPQLVVDAHRAYLDAGADVVQTNAFLAYLREPRGRRRRTLQLAALDCARTAVAAHGTTAGATAPGVVATLGPAGSDPRDHWYDLELLLEAEVRAVRCETVTSLAVGRAFLDAWADVGAGVRDVEVLLGCSVSVPTPWLDELASTAPEEVRVGLNCCDGPSGLRTTLERLVERRPAGTVWVDPSAGLPPYLEPDAWSDIVQELVDGLELRAVGGCCGTTPDHVAALAGAVTN